MLNLYFEDKEGELRFVSGDVFQLRDYLSNNMELRFIMVTDSYGEDEREREMVWAVGDEIAEKLESHAEADLRPRTEAFNRMFGDDEGEEEAYDDASYAPMEAAAQQGMGMSDDGMNPNATMMPPADMQPSPYYAQAIQPPLENHGYSGLPQTPSFGSSGSQADDSSPVESPPY